MCTYVYMYTCVHVPYTETVVHVHVIIVTFENSIMTVCEVANSSTNDPVGIHGHVHVHVYVTVI